MKSKKILEIEARMKIQSTERLQLIDAIEIARKRVSTLRNEHSMLWWEREYLLKEEKLKEELRFWKAIKTRPDFKTPSEWDKWAQLKEQELQTLTDRRDCIEFEPDNLLKQQIIKGKNGTQV